MERLDPPHIPNAVARIPGPKRKRAPRHAITRMVEVVRSFSFKLNVGNYESRDFFCSEKAVCPLDKAEEVSVALYQFCKRQVLRDVREYDAERKAILAGELPRPAVHPVAATNARAFEQYQAKNGQEVAK
jgi:hypothetical protein